VLQYLNTDGFGSRYRGNAEEENYVTIADAVQFSDLFNPELTGTERVDIDGTILLPEVGAVHVAGLTRTELEALLNQKYAPFYQINDFQVLIQTGLRFYYVLGQVDRPGPKPFQGDLTLFEAVLESTPKRHASNLGRVRLVRPDPRDPLVITANIGEMMRTGDSTFNVLIQERDIVVIPPTLMAQIGNFLVALISPITEVIQSVFQSIFAFERFNRFGRFGGNNLLFNAF
jgi:polysaccharide export outer membrane protein